MNGTAKNGDRCWPATRHHKVSLSSSESVQLTVSSQQTQAATMSQHRFKEQQLQKVVFCAAERFRLATEVLDEHQEKLDMESFMSRYLNELASTLTFLNDFC
jgi:hypothetical protein